jgi:hypothetical protein
VNIVRVYNVHVDIYMAYTHYYDAKFIRIAIISYMYVHVVYLLLDLCSYTYIHVCILLMMSFQVM